MTLENMDLKTKNWSHVGEEQTVKREEEEEEEEEEKKRKRRSRGMELWIFGMETNIDCGLYDIWHGSLGL